MTLTAQQRSTLIAAIIADSAVSQRYVDGDLSGVADYLNGTAAPDFIVWKKSVSRHEIIAETSLEGTTFAWAGGGYITRSQGERDAFREMFNSTGTVDPRKPAILAAFADIFSGTGGAGNRAHIDATSKRKATIVERILAVGAGLGTLGSPATLTVESPISYTDLQG